MTDQLYYIQSTGRDFESACDALEKAVAAHGFSVLGVHDLGEKLRSKGVSFEQQCRVFEVCNPVQAGRVLASDMRINMALPCRISVYTDDGGVRIGMIRPEALLSMLASSPDLAQVASEVEQATREMIDQAAASG